ncbi:MAG TPA: 4-hydroxybenzoate octaprenyltransferase [Acetobacteraceae bacterium]|nr:4-hydroxybenzoate octaprenyltransferase [Acetobacteraceae bacterium]
MNATEPLAEDLSADLLEPRPRRKTAPLSHRLGRRLHEYALLARFDRPIGIWLLLWPVLWALWIAGSGRPASKVLLVFAAGVFAMRAAGCVINDLADRNIDPRIRRTRQRPLAARRVTPYEALVLFVLLSAAALWLVLQLDALTFRLSLVGAALTISYPFVKRFFPLPQLYLGISFGGWGVPMAFAAQLGQVPRIAWLVFMAAVVWAVIYDTLYAMVDREDDLKVGVHSTAIAFADMDRAMIGILQLLMLAALSLVGRTLHFGAWFYGGLMLAAATFIYQQWLIRARDPNASLQAFLNNNYTGVAIFAGILLQYLYGT